MILTEQNYFSNEVDMHYMSASQFTSFLRCEAKTLAQLTGEYPKEVTQAMLVGSYLDAMVEGRTEEFIATHPEIFKKNGEPYAAYTGVELLYERLMKDPLFRSYLEGDKQTILTGEIGGVPFKGKLDVAHPERTVDLKTTKDFRPVWDSDRHSYVTFAEFWRYDIQGAIYQELRRLRGDGKLPHYLAVITKESEPDLAVLHIPEDALQFALAEVVAYAQDFQAIKLGFKQPSRCGQCDYCKSTKTLDQAIDWLEVGL